MDQDLSVVIAINKELGDNFDNLTARCKKYRDDVLKRQHDITENIKSNVVNKDSNMYKILKKVHDERSTIISLKNEVEELKLRYNNLKKDTDTIKNTFKKLIVDLKYKCNQLIYFSCLRFIASKNNKIRTDLMSKHDNEAITSYNVLYELSVAMTNAPCKNFVSYLHKLINYWNCLLQHHYSDEFEIILKQINWPFTMSESTDAATLNHKQNFQRLAKILIMIQLPKNECIDFNDQSPTSQLMVHFSRISLPITILIVPFRKRFFFHFTGKKQTNKPDKPEWFLSRILSWIRDYRPFIIDWLGPVYKDNYKRPIDSQHEFIIGLLQSVIVKLDFDLSHFQLEDVVFSHIVDETLAFEHELRKVYNYPNECPSVTEVLTQPHIFFKWINMERKYANIKMDAILHNEQWKILVYDSQYSMTACADSFLILLNTMSDRYSVLRQPRHKLQFLKLQTDLLEEFKQKIIDGFNENKSNEYLPEMLCTLHYISYTLYNWGTNMHFLSLLNHKCELENELKIKSENLHTDVFENSETVFDDSIQSYNLGIEHLLDIQCDDIMAKIKRSSKLYKKDKWHIMNSLKDDSKYSITDSGWVMYESLTENLNTLHKTLPISLFNKCWPMLATKFSTFIINDVLLANMFNKGGAQHLLCDVQYKLLPIFSKYTAKPSIYIERLLEACKVLYFELNFKPVIITRNEVSEILLRRIEHGNSIE